MSVLNPYVQFPASTGSSPGYILAINSASLPSWVQPWQTAQSASWSAYEFGAMPQQGIFTKVSTNGGTLTAMATDGTHQAVGRVNAGSTSASGSQASVIGSTSGTISFNSVSGKIVYESVFKLNALSHSTASYVFNTGFIDNSADSSVSDGAYITLDNTVSTQFKFITSTTGSKATTATGVVAAINTWYRARITVTNNTSATCELALETASLSVLATHTTNIPNGLIGQSTGAGLIVAGASGSDARRSIDYTWQNVYRSEIPTQSPAVSNIHGVLNGFGLPIRGNEGIGSILTISESSAQQWLRHHRRARYTPFVAYDTGFGGSDFTTTSSSGTVTQSGASGRFGILVLTAILMGGSVGRSTGASGAGILSLASDSGRIVYECIFSVPVASGGTQLFVTRVGLMNSVTGTPSNGAWIELDANADLQFQCKTAAGGSTTTTDSGVTANTGYYFVRITITNNTSVTFEIASLDSALVAVAVHTLTIPSSSTQAVSPSAMIRLSSGASNSLLYVAGQLCYQEIGVP